MNANRRKEISKIAQRILEIQGLVEGIIVDVESIKDEEEECYDNLPESIQNTDRGENMQAAIDELDDIISNLDSIKDDVENIADQVGNFEY